MNFKIDHRIFEKFPGLTVGVVICKNVDNSGEQEEVKKELRKQEDDIRVKYNTETLSQTPNIEVWRRAYSAFGAKPKENKSSVENIYRLVLQGINVKHINPLVDIYNFISLKHTVPVGSEDIDKIQGDVILTFAEPDEPAVLLLGDKEPRPPHAGEVIYKDNISAICRRWNWREADRTKLTTGTKHCFLVIEGLPPVTKQKIEDATRELKDVVQKFCGGDISYTVLDERQLTTPL